MSKGGNLPRSGPVVQENYGGMPTPMPQLPPRNLGPVPLYNDPQPVGPTTGATGGSPVPLYNQEPVNVDTLPSEIFNEIAVAASVDN